VLGIAIDVDGLGAWHQVTPSFFVAILSLHATLLELLPGAARAGIVPPDLILGTKERHRLALE
jgi:hypothetical protein